MNISEILKKNSPAYLEAYEEGWNDCQHLILRGLEQFTEKTRKLEAVVTETSTSSTFEEK